MIGLGDDLKYLDGVEPVSVAPAGGGAGMAVDHAVRRRVTVEEAAASGGAVTMADVRWHMPKTELSQPPAPGAVITDGDDAAWTVLRVDHDVLGTVWRCWCRSLAVADALSQSITLQRAVWRVGPSGAAVALWVDDQVNVPARIQPVRETIEVVHQRRTARVTHKVYVAAPVAVDDNLRVVHAGVAYRVLGYEAAERIDVLPAILVEQAPWPL
jgi:hypothetical protein